MMSTSCSSQSNPTIIEIRYGSQFGECEGYCFSEMVYTKHIEKSISKAWGDTILNPTKIVTKKMQQTRWTHLITAINLSDFYSLEPTIGCPDCADGGESWIAIKTNEKSYKVRYEYGDVPKPMTNLVAIIERL